MEKHEAQERAIKLSMGDNAAESREHMDVQGKVHTCPACGHEMPMDEVLGHAGGEKLSEGDEHAESRTHMDREGQIK